METLMSLSLLLLLLREFHACSQLQDTQRHRRRPCLHTFAAQVLALLLVHFLVSPIGPGKQQIVDGVNLRHWSYNPNPPQSLGDCVSPAVLQTRTAVHGTRVAASDCCALSCCEMQETLACVMTVRRPSCWRGIPVKPQKNRRETPGKGRHYVSGKAGHRWTPYSNALTQLPTWWGYLCP